MLVLSRRADESIVIQPADGVDANMTMAQLFANCPIQITLLCGTGRRVKMGIEAPEKLSIRRKYVAQDAVFLTALRSNFTYRDSGLHIQLGCLRSLRYRHGDVHNETPKNNSRDLGWSVDCTPATA